MALSTINKVVIGAITTGGFAGATAYVHHELTKVTIKDKLGETLLSYEQKDNEKWKARGASLSKAGNELSSDLNKIKTEKDENGSKIKGWCQTNIKNKFTSDKDTLFLEVQKYCTYNIKDKIGNAIDTTKWEKDKHNKRIKELKEDREWISKEMKAIKDKLNQAQPEEDALKNWCASSYEKPFKGDEDQGYRDTLNYCVHSEE